MYHVNCECGQRIDVKLVQAGVDLPCPNCGRDVCVPNTVKLKELAGDEHPDLSPLERAAVALEEQVDPFDGRCHQCHKYEADHEVVVHFDFLVERFLDNDGGLSVKGSGLSLVVSGGEENWGTFDSPLFFCEQCYSEFSARRKRARLLSVARVLGIALLVGPLIFLMILFIAFIPFIGPAIIFILIMAARYRGRKKVDRNIQSIVERLPHIGEAIQGEDEYRIRLGAVRRRIAGPTGDA